MRCIAKVSPLQLFSKADKGLQNIHLHLFSGQLFFNLIGDVIILQIDIKNSGNFKFANLIKKFNLNLIKKFSGFPLVGIIYVVLLEKKY